jgi:hypothetical protein
MAYDAATLEQVSVYNSTPYGEAGGIWMSGEGPSADTDGNIYAVTGNGTVGLPGDPTNVINRGESFLKLTPNGSTLLVASWFTPYNYEELNVADTDLGSAGFLMIPGTRLGISGGKGGLLYLVDRDHMGGLNVGSDSQILQTLPNDSNHHIHGSPAHWRGPMGPLVYIWAEYAHLKAYRLDLARNQFELPPYSESKIETPFGMPGAMISISANGDDPESAIVWAHHQLSGNANQAVRPGILHALSAVDLTRELWNSEQNPERDSYGNFAKFSYPTIANGKVYLATFSNQLCVYGELKHP